MKSVFYIVLLFASGLFTSCQKSQITTSPDAILLFSSLNLTSDTLHFDTVFTSAGSTTQIVKIFNLNAQKLRLDRIHLFGGSSSAYKINLSGLSGTDYSNIEIPAGDSIYLFAKVYIDPNAASQPFLVQDSIGFDFNGKSSIIQLEAYGQNAHYLRGQTIINDTTWTNELPIVLLGQTTVVENKILSIAKGTKIYSHANAVLRVNGSLQVNGDTAIQDRVFFTNDRLDEGYSTLSGSWPGIVFGINSRDNVLNYTTVQNAASAIVDTNDVALPTPKIILNGCIINNVSGNGLLLRNSNITATNCLISNCGQNIHISYGGSYNFRFTTVAGMNNRQVYHQNPSIALSNYNSQDQDAPLDVVFRNCIVWGSGNFASEISTAAKGSSAWSVLFDHSLIQALPANITASNAVLGQDPLFFLTDNDRILYDFHLLANSPGKNAGTSISGANTDLDGLARDASNPSIGCYE